MSQLPLFCSMHLSGSMEVYFLWPVILAHGPGSLILHLLAPIALWLAQRKWELHAGPGQDLHVFEEEVKIAQKLRFPSFLVYLDASHAQNQEISIHGHPRLMAW